MLPDGLSRLCILIRVCWWGEEKNFQRVSRPPRNPRPIRILRTNRDQTAPPRSCAIFKKRYGWSTLHQNIHFLPIPIFPSLPLKRQPPIQKLRPPLPKTPILLPILRTTNNQLLPRYLTLFLQRHSQFFVKFLFGIFIAALLEDLDEDELVCAFVVEAGVEADPVGLC